MGTWFWLISLWYTNVDEQELYVKFSVNLVLELTAQCLSVKTKSTLKNHSISSYIYGAVEKVVKTEKPGWLNASANPCRK